jgi:hypothetical protein
MEITLMSAIFMLCLSNVRPIRGRSRGATHNKPQRSASFTWKSSSQETFVRKAQYIWRAAFKYSPMVQPILASCLWFQVVAGIVLELDFITVIFVSIWVFRPMGISANAPGAELARISLN